MFSSFRMGAIAFSLTVLLVAPASGQNDQMRLGGRVDYHANSHVFGVGTQFSAPIFNRVEFYPSAEYYFLDGDWRYTGNLDLKWSVPKQPLDLYLGTGVGIRNAAANGVTQTGVGMNFFGGFYPPTGLVKPFAELRIFVGRDTHVGLAMGVNYAVGRVKR